ncbi:MAG: ATP-binding protein [Sodaliphilus sp.]
MDAWLGKGQIIVLVGQRRVGKSFVLKDFAKRHEVESDAHIIYIDKEKKDFNYIQNHEQLNAYIDEHYSLQKHNYILIDEVQDIDGWEHSVRSYRTEPNTDIIITGSNSKMLSGELSTLLSGRCEEIHIQGLSYGEFLEFHSLSDSDDALWLYLNFGGMPGLRNIGIRNGEMVNDYLSGVYNTIMLKDVIERHAIRNIPFLRKFIVFIADTVGKLNSANSIVKYLKSQNVVVSVSNVLNYISNICEAYLTYKVDRFDIHGKKILQSNSKYYFGDMGLRNFIAGGERDADVEKVIENVVYLHLLRLGYDVKVGQLKAGEIDFVCTKPGKRVYVQVAYLISGDKTRKREFGNLSLIPDNYPKYVISASPFIKSSDYEGVTHLHLRQFLLQGL